MHIFILLDDYGDDCGSHQMVKLVITMEAKKLAGEGNLQERRSAANWWCGGAASSMPRAGYGEGGDVRKRFGYGISMGKD